MIIISKFNGTCKACGNQIMAGERVIYFPGIKGVTHVNAGACEGAPKAAPKAYVTVTANAKPVADFLNAAKERGLKYPKVAFIMGGATITLKLAGAASKNPGAVFVFIGGNYSGSIATDGTVRGALAKDAATLASLDQIMVNPAAAAKAYAQVTGACSFCAKELTDAGSIEVGYGPVCARKYGLPHTAKGKAANVELAFAAA